LTTGRAFLRSIATLALAGVATLSTLVGQAAEAARPALESFKIATIAAADLGEIERRYGRWIDYKVRERGKVPRDLARSWGAPKAAGRDYILLSSDAAPEVFIRVVRTPGVKGYEPLTTHGWNAIEIIVDDPDALFTSMAPSPFTVIGEPAPLGSYPTIRAFQVVGSASEVLYLTAETGDRSKSILPDPNGRVGRIFIMVVAGPDIHALQGWYVDKFNLPKNPVRERPLKLLTRAQNLAPDRAMPIVTARLAEHGNLIEFDGYSENTTPRPRRKGELPHSIAMTSFIVRDLDALKLDYITPPAVRSGLAYQGRRAATVVGPAGELIELIEASAAPR
jgi:hypothetical protein